MSQDKLVAGRYRYLRSLGRGGFSDVVLAEDVRLGGRLVAIKRIAYHLLHDPERLEKFQQEADIIGRLTSPFTVRAFDYGKDDDGRYFIVMEYVKGLTLHKALAQEGPFTVERTLQIGIQLLDALEEAHEQGIIHRDLKPKNIILAPTRQGDLVKVLDFGVARILDPEDESDDWTLVGTASYMAPEQAQGKPISPASDLYSVGVLLYHALSGKPPFVSQEDPVAVMIHHATKPVTPLRTARPDLNIPEVLDRIVLRALEKQPTRRYTRASEFRDALEDLLDSDDLLDTMHGNRDNTAPYGAREGNPFLPSSSASLPASADVMMPGKALSWEPVGVSVNTIPETRGVDPEEMGVGLILTGTNPEAAPANPNGPDTQPEAAAAPPRSGTLHAHLPPPPMVRPAGSVTTLPYEDKALPSLAPPRVSAFNSPRPLQEAYSYEGHQEFSPSDHEEVDADTQLTTAANNPAAYLPSISDDELITATSLSADSLNRGIDPNEQDLATDQEALPHLSEDDLSTASTTRSKAEEDAMLLDDLLVFKSEHDILDALLGEAPSRPDLPGSESTPEISDLKNSAKGDQLLDVGEPPDGELPSTLDLKPTTKPKNNPTHPPGVLKPPTSEIEVLPEATPPVEATPDPAPIPLATATPSLNSTTPYGMPIVNGFGMPEQEEPTDDEWDLQDTAQATISWEGLDEDATMSLGPDEQTMRRMPGESDGMGDIDVQTDPENYPNATMLSVPPTDIDEHTLEPTESTQASPFYIAPALTPAPQPAPAAAYHVDPYQGFTSSPSDTAPHTMMQQPLSQPIPTPMQAQPSPPQPQGPVASWDLPEAFLEPERESKSPEELGLDWQDDFDDDLSASFQPNQRLRWGILGGAVFLVGLIALLASAGEGKEERQKRHRKQAYADALKDGDEAIRKSLYHKAYASYKQALKLRPNNRQAAHRLHITGLDLEAFSYIKRATVLEGKGQLLQAYRLLQKIDSKSSLWEERGQKKLSTLHQLILRRLGIQINYFRRKRRWHQAHIRCLLLPKFYAKHPLLKSTCPFVHKKFKRQRRRRR